MLLIVGLGNPGKKYEKTRHNAGFMVLDELEEKVLPGVRLLKPDTFMNNSGSVVKAAAKKLKIYIPKKLIVIHDDIDIPLGKIKVSKGSGSAGHKGAESIIQALGTKDFTRIRIGILPSTGKPEDVENFVLKNFKKEELLLLHKAIEDSCVTIENLLSVQTKSRLAVDN